MFVLNVARAVQPSIVCFVAVVVSSDDDLRGGMAHLHNFGNGEHIAFSPRVNGWYPCRFVEGCSGSEAFGDQYLLRRVITGEAQWGKRSCCFRAGHDFFEAIVSDEFKALYFAFSINHGDDQLPGLVDFGHVWLDLLASKIGMFSGCGR